MANNNSLIMKRFCFFCSSELNHRFIEGRVRLFCTECQIPIYENPLPAACVVLINSLNEVLLVKRNINPKKGSWCLPGGFIEIGENPEEAAKRELQEETGLIGEVDSLVGVSSSNNRGLNSIVVIGYFIKIFHGLLSPGDDASDAQFFNFKKMPKIAFESHIYFINTSYLKYLD